MLLDPAPSPACPASLWGLPASETGGWVSQAYPQLPPPSGATRNPSWATGHWGSRRPSCWGPTASGSWERHPRHARHGRPNGARGRPGRIWNVGGFSRHRPTSGCASELKNDLKVLKKHLKSTNTHLMSKVSIICFCAHNSKVGDWTGNCCNYIRGWRELKALSLLRAVGLTWANHDLHDICHLAWMGKSFTYIGSGLVPCLLDLLLLGTL